SSTTCRPSPRSIPVTYTLRVTRALRFVGGPQESSAGRGNPLAATKIAHRGERIPLDSTSAAGYDACPSGVRGVPGGMKQSGLAHRYRQGPGDTARCVSEFSPQAATAPA